MWRGDRVLCDPEHDAVVEALLPLVALVGRRPALDLAEQVLVHDVFEARAQRLEKLLRSGGRELLLGEDPLPEGSKAVKSAALEAASSSNRGSGWAPSGSASPWECRAAQSRQARPEEAQEPSWGTAKGAR